MKYVRFFTVLALCIAFTMRPVEAVSGISVVCRNGADALPYYSIMNGELWRIEIRDNKLTPVKILDAGCSFPKISPSGRTVAFVRGTKICLVDITGGDVTELCDCHQHSVLDFPSDDWIYFAMGGFNESSSKQLKRVNTSNGNVEDVASCSYRISQIGVSNDLSRMVVRTGDAPDGPIGMIIAVDLPTNGSDYRRVDGNSTWNCASGIFGDGQHVMDGWQDGVGGGVHAGMDIRLYSDGSLVESYANADALNWPPNSGSWKPSNNGNTHGIFSSCGAANSDRWACMVMGNASNRIYISEGQVLINFKDKQCIVPTKGLDGTFDCGDFWEGNPDDVLGGGNTGESKVKVTDGQSYAGVDGFLAVTAEKVTIRATERGVAVSVPLNGHYRVAVYDVNGRLAASVEGTHAGTHLLGVQALPPGSYIVKVRQGGRTLSARFCTF